LGDAAAGQSSASHVLHRQAEIRMKRQRRGKAVKGRYITVSQAPTATLAAFTARVAFRILR
jgi:hypothetical protein